MYRLEDKIPKPAFLLSTSCCQSPETPYAGNTRIFLLNTSFSGFTSRQCVEKKQSTIFVCETESSISGKPTRHFQRGHRLEPGCENRRAGQLRKRGELPSKKNYTFQSTFGWSVSTSIIEAKKVQSVFLIIVFIFSAK